MSEEFILQNAEHLCTATAMRELPEATIPEVAFVGRSNVGKSSLLNRLTNRKKLAHTSSVPGKTQALNFFSIEGKLGGVKVDPFYFVDLPGFGFAKFAKKKREYISRFTVEYILSRKSLKAVFLLNDIRRTPKEDELAIQQIGYESEVPVIIILTKTDKVKRNDLQKQRKLVANSYNLISDDILLAGEKVSTANIWTRLLAVL